MDAHPTVEPHRGASILLAACAPTPTDAPTVTAQATASPTPPTTAPATTSPRPSLPAGALALPTQFAVELEPATYFSSPPFELGFTFEVDDRGWVAGHLNDEFFDLQLYEGEPAVGVLPMRMVGFGHPAHFRSATGDLAASEPTPREAVDLLAARDDLEAGNVRDMDLAGRPSARVDLHSDRINNPLFGGDDGNFGLGPDLDVRLAVVPLQDGPLVIVVLAPPTELDDAWTETRTILESVDLEP